MKETSNNDERRRYFRINETVGIGYERLENKQRHIDDFAQPHNPEAIMASLLDVVVEQDSKIEQLLVEVETSHPKVAELVTVFNQKLERVISHLLIENQLIARIAHKVREANISACGIAFINDEPIEVGASLHLELTLYPSETRVETNGRVVGCDQEEETYYWRIDFFGMSRGAQETLIQHIVRTQSAQLKNNR